MLYFLYFLKTLYFMFFITRKYKTVFSYQKVFFVVLKNNCQIYPKYS